MTSDVRLDRQTPAARDYIGNFYPRVSLSERTSDYSSKKFFSMEGSIVQAVTSPQALSTAQNAGCLSW
jgi:hypothetical protein